MESSSGWSTQSVVAIALASLLALPPRAFAQQPGTGNSAGAPGAPQPVAEQVQSLQIFVLVGQESVNDIRQRTTSSPVVEVRDSNGLPLEGAEVRFELPAVGPGGAFAGQKSTATARTNFQGQAMVTFVPNQETGRFNIRVTAVSGNRTGQAVITQTNALRASSSESRSGLFKLTWWKVAIVAGAGATIGFLVARGGGSSGPSVTLIPGTPTFGAP